MTGAEGVGEKKPSDRHMNWKPGPLFKGKKTVKVGDHGTNSEFHLEGNIGVPGSQGEAYIATEKGAGNGKKVVLKVGRRQF